MSSEVFRVYYAPEHVKHEPRAHVTGGSVQQNVIGSVHGHPECSSRLTTILSVIKTKLHSRVQIVEVTREANNEEIAACHSLNLITFLEKANAKLRSQTEEYDEVVPGVFPHFIKPQFRAKAIANPDMDVIATAGLFCYDTCTPIGEFSVQCARQAAAASVDAALELDIANNKASSYALLRPPGHHAGREYYGGFCYFNNAAIAAQVLLDRFKKINTDTTSRIAIIDLDYHHGNGTQDIFYETDEIVYFSIHASPEFDYPHFSGAKEETGSGKGESYNFNYPLPQNATFEDHYVPAMTDIITKLKQEQFKSNAIVVSLGMDALKNDPVGSYNLLPENFEYFGREIRSLELPTITIQEGGYNPDRNFFADAVISFVSQFI